LIHYELPLLMFTWIFLSTFIRERNVLSGQISSWCTSSCHMPNKSYGIQVQKL